MMGRTRGSGVLAYGGVWRRCDGVESRERER